ncbi:hypothetical protein E2562_035513 [Oryza meyeriana var. granulata]|uniref:DUF834 domain-containing protein n=1 Tax=Oryza meyeriana var. granulata TaxID=110450 RepID=A0A6G1DAR3_9ORYZ|nr:hypothetical protein E2562_035513 [Oryza meyeriana var. granulata]
MELRPSATSKLGAAGDEHSKVDTEVGPAASKLAAVAGEIRGGCCRPWSSKRDVGDHDALW